MQHILKLPDHMCPRRPHGHGYGHGGKHQQHHHHKKNHLNPKSQSTPFHPQDQSKGEKPEKVPVDHWAQAMGGYQMLYGYTGYPPQMSSYGNPYAYMQMPMQMPFYPQAPPIYQQPMPMVMPGQFFGHFAARPGPVRPQMHVPMGIVPEMAGETEQVGQSNYYGRTGTTTSQQNQFTQPNSAGLPPPQNSKRARIGSLNEPRLGRQ